MNKFCNFLNFFVFLDIYIFNRLYSSKSDIDICKRNCNQLIHVIHILYNSICNFISSSQSRLMFFCRHPHPLHKCRSVHATNVKKPFISVPHTKHASHSRRSRKCWQKRESRAMKIRHATRCDSSFFKRLSKSDRIPQTREHK